MSTVALGAALGLASSIAINWGYFAQHDSSKTAPTLKISEPIRLLHSLFSRPLWALGFGIGWIGWIVYIAGLRFAPLSVVQACESGGVAVLAILTYRSNVGLPKSHTVGVGAAIVGLVLLGITIDSSTGATAGVSSTSVLLASGMLAGIGLIGAIVPERVIARGPALAIVAGCFYSACDVASKAAVDGQGFYFWGVLVVTSIIGFYAMQLSFQRANALSTAGLTTLVGSALPIVIGFVTFHDRLPHGAFGVLRVIGFVAVVFGATALMRSPVASAEAMSPKTISQPG